MVLWQSCSAVQLSLDCLQKVKSSLIQLVSSVTTGITVTSFPYTHLCWFTIDQRVLPFSRLLVAHSYLDEAQTLEFRHLSVPKLGLELQEHSNET